MIDEKVLIERLEELRKCSDFGTCNHCQNRWCPMELLEADDVIKIVNQLAEEHNLTPCYLGSPCEYQNENAILPNELLADDNGWIPCSERLPNIGERVFLWVYGRVHIGKRIDAKLFEEYDIFILESGTNESTKRIEAWQPLPAPYMPKGE